MISQYGLINSSSIDTSTLYMIMLGATWPGKRVTGLNYILEFLPQKNQKNYITFFTILDYPSILIISIYYQYINVNWYGQQFLGLILSTLCVTYCMVMMPESPKYLYMNGSFEESRQIINRMCKFNGIKTQHRFLFDTEATLRETEESEPLVANTSSHSVEVQKMSNSEFKWNILRMTIMWSAVSFCTYLLHFQLKYLQGSIFTNNNYCAISDAIAVMCGGYIYSKFGLKITYYFSYFLSIIGGAGILILEYIHKVHQDEGTLTNEYNQMFHTRMP